MPICHQHNVCRAYVWNHWGNVKVIYLQSYTQKCWLRLNPMEIPFLRHLLVYNICCWKWKLILWWLLIPYLSKLSLQIERVNNFLVTHWSLLFAPYLLLFSRCSLLCAHCSLLYSLLGTFCSLLVILCSLLVTLCSWLVVLCSLLVSFCLLLVIFLLVARYCWLVYRSFLLISLNFSLQFWFLCFDKFRLSLLLLFCVITS